MGSLKPYKLITRHASVLICLFIAIEKNSCNILVWIFAWSATCILTVLSGIIITVVTLCTLLLFYTFKRTESYFDTAHILLSFFLPLKYGSRPITFARFCFLILGSFSLLTAFFPCLRKCLETNTASYCRRASIIFLRI